MKKQKGYRKMKKIQKLLSLLLAIIMLAGALAGCAGGEKARCGHTEERPDEQTPAVDTSASAAATTSSSAPRSGACNARSQQHE